MECFDLCATMKRKYNNDKVNWYYLWVYVISVYLSSVEKNTIIIKPHGNSFLSERKINC